MDLKEFGAGELRLLNGERIIDRLSASKRGGRQFPREPGALLLTNDRLIHLSGEDRKQRATMFSIQDVESVSVRLIFSEGIGPYLWAALSVIMSLMLYSYLEHSLARIAVPLVIVAMGAYLILDRLMEKGKPSAFFRVRESEIEWPFDPDKESREVYDFINSLYRAKRESQYGIDEWLSLR